MTATAVFNRCIETMAAVSLANAIIYQKMRDSGEWSKEQVEMARQTAKQSLEALDRMILNYLMGL
jgi:hypothetical protein